MELSDNKATELLESTHQQKEVEEGRVDYMQEEKEKYEEVEGNDDHMEEQNEILMCAEECEEEREPQVEAIAVQNSTETEITITNDSSLYLASSEGDNDSDNSERSECKMRDAEVKMWHEKNKNQEKANKSSFVKKEYEEFEEKDTDNASDAKVAKTMQKTCEKNATQTNPKETNECKSVISSLALFDNISSETAKPIAVSSQSAQSSPGLTEDERAEMSSSSACHSGLFQYHDNLSEQQWSESFGSGNRSNNRYHHRHTRYFEREQPMCYPEYGCCVFFFPSPVLSWLFPLAGHVGITNAEGSMLYTFESPYFVREERLSDVMDEIIFQEAEEHKKERTQQEEQLEMQEQLAVEKQEHSQHECEEASKNANVLKVEEKVQEPLSSLISSVATTMKSGRHTHNSRIHYVDTKKNDDDTDDDHIQSKINIPATCEEEFQEKESKNDDISELSKSFNASSTTASINANSSNAHFSTCEVQELNNNMEKEEKVETHPSYVLASASSPISEIIPDACRLHSSFSSEKYVGELEKKTTTSSSFSFWSPSEESSSSSSSSPLLSAQQKSPFILLTGLKSKLLHFIWPFGEKSQGKAKLQEAEHTVHKSHSKKKPNKHLGHSHCRCVSVWDLKSLLIQSNTSKSFSHHSHFGTAVWIRLQELLQSLEGHDDVFHFRRHSSDGDEHSSECSNVTENNNDSHNRTRIDKSKLNKQTNKENNNNTLKLDDHTAHLYNRNLQASIKLFRASADGANDTPELLIHQHYSFSLVAFVLEACGVGQRRQHNKDVKNSTNREINNATEYKCQEGYKKVDENDVNGGCKSKEDSNFGKRNEDAYDKQTDKIVSTPDATALVETNRFKNNANVASSLNVEQAGSLSSEVDEEIYWGVPKLLYYIWRYGKWHRTGYWPRRWMHGGNCYIAAALWLILIAVCMQYVYMWYLIWRNPVQETGAVITTISSEPVAITTVALTSEPSTSSSPLFTETIHV